MRIIVVGGGKVGKALCRSLVEENHDVILIEQNESVLKQISKRYDILGINGNGANHKILEQADVEDCDIFISVTDKDEVNMIAAVIAKKMGAKETVVRVRNPEYANSYIKDRNILGFSTILNPEFLAARTIANMVDFPNALSVESFGNGRMTLMEFKITDNSPLVKVTLSQFRKKFGNVLVCAIERGGEIIIPKGEAVIESGDNIFVTGNRVEMILFHNYIRANIVRNLMIIGAGKITYYLLNILKNTKIRVKVIEVNPKRAEFFSQEFPRLHVVLGDGTAKEVLLEENAVNYDAVATLTGVDEENIISSMYLESIGVQKNITKVNRTSLLEIIDDKEFSSIVTPKIIAADFIMHFVRGRQNAQHSNLEAMHHLAQGKIEALQFKIQPQNKMAGKKLSSLKFKKDVLIAAIIRNNKTIFPNGEEFFEVGDKVIVITMMNNITHIYDLFQR